jgi:hypothetical protein
MSAKVKAVVARGRVCAGALAERPSFCEEAEGTNNGIISTGWLWCVGWEGGTGRQIANAKYQRNSNADKELKDRTWKIGQQSFMDGHDSRRAPRQAASVVF